MSRKIDQKHQPGYLALHEDRTLAERAQMLDELLSCCTICPRRCRVDRKSGKLGACGVNAGAKVASINIHPWEEPPISGTTGSGTIFFSGCTLECLFCQNYPISQMGVGRYMSAEELALGMVSLQKKGAHNINLVTPTHQMPAFVQALAAAVPMGLHIPIVYNTSGYERVETLRLLEGIVDIYLPDIKYSDAGVAGFCSGRDDYVPYNRAALLEMWRQVGPLRVDDRELAYRGMMVRHLVLPENLSGTGENMTFLADNIGAQVWVSLMNQYFPAHKAHGRPPLDRKASEEEYEEAFRVLVDLGLDNGFIQMPRDETGC
jgi:putative pyruvate formate lyase activating enzyme